MFDSTPDSEESPPSASTDQPSQEPTDTVESLKEKLAATEQAKLDAEEDAKRWKNRVKDENPPKEKKKEDPDEAYADWRIDNKDRIGVVKEQYEKELSELQDAGVKVTIPMREKALRLAEATVGVKKAEKDEPIPSGSVDRTGGRQPALTESDVAFGVKPETVQKNPVTW